MQTFHPEPARPVGPAFSLLIHAAAIGALILATRYAQQLPPDSPAPDAPLLLPLTIPAGLQQLVGGGGGKRQPLPASAGQLPTRARDFVMPPRTEPIAAELILPPAIDAPAPPPVPNIAWGDPTAHAGPPSDGAGTEGGIGNGRGPSVGNRRGPGVGASDGPGGLRVYRISGEVSAPKLIAKIEPEYSEEARKARVQGAVQMEIVVGEDGRVRGIRILHPLGMGLDEQAVDAVAKWRFRPGVRAGRPVAVRAIVEVNFRLL